MSEKQGYAYHYNKARTEFIDWYYKKHVDQELASFWFTNCGHIDDMLIYDDELKFALEAFDESEQVKILYHYDRGDHCLKIKWEVMPWWEGQVLHFYYCVMLPIDNLAFQTPYQLAVGEEE